MSEDKKEWVQCFYNVEFFYLGTAKYAWGFTRLKILGDAINIVDQIKKDLGFNIAEISNLNIKTLTPFHSNVFEVE